MNRIKQNQTTLRPCCDDRGRGAKHIGPIKGNAE